MAVSDEKEVKILTVAEAAYLAGIIDGEGSICISAARPPRKYQNPSTKCPEYRGLVKIVNTNLEMLMWVRDRIGGGIFKDNARLSPSAQRSTIKSRKPGFIWQLQGRQTVKLCQQLLPFLIIKKKRAELVIELYSGFRSPEHGANWKKPLDQAELDRREDCRQRLLDA